MFCRAVCRHIAQAGIQLCVTGFQCCLTGLRLVTRQRCTLALLLLRDVSLCVAELRLSGSRHTLGRDSRIIVGFDRHSHSRHNIVVCYTPGVYSAAFLSGLCNTQSPEMGLSRFAFGRGSGSRCICLLSVCGHASTPAVGCLGCSGVPALCQDVLGVFCGQCSLQAAAADRPTCCVMHRQGTFDNITAPLLYTAVTFPLMEHTLALYQHSGLAS